MFPLLGSIHSKSCLITLEYRTQMWKKKKSLLEITTGGEEKVRKYTKHSELHVWRMPGEGGGFHEILGKPFDDVTPHT